MSEHEDGIVIKNALMFYRDYVQSVQGLAAFTSDRGRMAKEALSGLDDELEQSREMEAVLRAALSAIQSVVDKQASDEGLWFLATSAAESYLQQELRTLHRVIESLTLGDGNG